jgi:hypothetical protein
MLIGALAGAAAAHAAGAPAWDLARRSPAGSPGRGARGLRHRPGRGPDPVRPGPGLTGPGPANFLGGPVGRGGPAPDGRARSRPGRPALPGSGCCSPTPCPCIGPARAPLAAWVTGPHPGRAHGGRWARSRRSPRHGRAVALVRPAAPCRGHGRTGRGLPVPGHTRVERRRCRRPGLDASPWSSSPAGGPARGPGRTALRGPHRPHLPGQGEGVELIASGSCACSPTCSPWPCSAWPRRVRTSRGGSPRTSPALSPPRMTDVDIPGGFAFSSGSNHQPRSGPLIRKCASSPRWEFSPYSRAWTSTRSRSATPGQRRQDGRKKPAGRVAPGAEGLPADRGPAFRLPQSATACPRLRRAPGRGPARTRDRQRLGRALDLLVRVRPGTAKTTSWPLPLLLHLTLLDPLCGVELRLPAQPDFSPSPWDRVLDPATRLGLCFVTNPGQTLGLHPAPAEELASPGPRLPATA